MSWKRLKRNLRSLLKGFYFKRGPDFTTKLLISVNLINYVAGKNAPTFMNDHFVISEQNILKDHKYYTIATSGIFHKSFFWMTINNFTLWHIGRPLSYSIGGSGVLVLYLTGVLSNFLGLLYTRIYQDTEFRPINGSDASIASVLAYFVLSNPWEQVCLLIVPMPSIILGAILLYANSKLKSNVYSYGACGGLFYFLLTILKRRI